MHYFTAAFSEVTEPVILLLKDLTLKYFISLLGFFFVCYLLLKFVTVPAANKHFAF